MQKLLYICRMKAMRLFLFIGMLCGLVACGNHTTPTATPPKPLHEFATPVPPVTFGRDQQVDFLRKRYRSPRSIRRR